MFKMRNLKVSFFLIGTLGLFLFALSSVEAHPLAPSLLEVEEVSAGQMQVLWKTPLAQIPGEFLQPLLPSICKSQGNGEAKKVEMAREEHWNVICESSLIGQSVGVQGFVNLQSNVILRVSLADGRKYQKILNSQTPQFLIPEHPQASVVFKSYSLLGVEHILGGWDHLLFVLGLILLVKSRKALLWTITAFTLGHSVTLSLAVLGFVRVPTTAVEAFIAFSILVLAVELTRTQQGKGTFFHRYPWAMAFSFGLLHGLGFAGALAEVGLPIGEIPMALLSFNVGIELGQLGFIAFILLSIRALNFLPILNVIKRREIAVYAIGSLSTFWFLERAFAYWD